MLRLVYFACRCPVRPNPIGMTTVKVTERKWEYTQRFKGYQMSWMEDLIDIKPYTPPYDAVEGKEITPIG